MRLKLDRSFYIPEGATAREEADSVVYTYTSPRGRLCALAFIGKAQKPHFNYSYTTEERRESAIVQFFDGRRRTLAFREDRRTERRADSAKRSALDFSGKDYLSSADVAALCRKALKESFPGTRFSVTSDGSLRVKWADGPSRETVERIAKQFAGSYFDGMIDYKGSIYHELDGRRVRFGADFVFVERDMSAEALEIGRLAYEAAEPSHAGAVTIDPTGGYHGSPVVRVAAEHPHVLPNAYQERTIAQPGGTFGTRFSGAPAWALEMWHDQARPVEPKPSPTLARIRVIGSDGYGDTVLPAADGGETGRGYPKPKESEEAQHARASIEAAERESAAMVESIVAGFRRGSASERARVESELRAFEALERLEASTSEPPAPDVVGPAALARRIASAAVPPAPALAATNSALIIPFPQSRRLH